MVESWLLLLTAESVIRNIKRIKSTDWLFVGRTISGKLVKADEYPIGKGYMHLADGSLATVVSFRSTALVILERDGEFHDRDEDGRPYKAAMCSSIDKGGT